MLNPAFPKNTKHDGYILKELQNEATEANVVFDTEEVRFDEVYTYEIWKKLTRLGLSPENFKGKEVLDLCAGSGFLSWHILKRARPAGITLYDISRQEIAHAEKIITPVYPEQNIKYSVGDFLIDEVLQKYDIIIGNSFLHHFCDVPEALRKIKQMLKPEGVFVALHEPTVASTAFESRNPKLLWSYIFKGRGYINELRKRYSVIFGKSSDIWIFPLSDYKKLFAAAGFDTVTANWNFLRPIVCAYSSFFPDSKFWKNFKNHLLKYSIGLDSILNKFLPGSWFGSVASRSKVI